MIPLDNNATTQPSPAVAAAVADALANLWANPSSIHRGGQSARNAVDLARARLADLLACSPKRLTFTSSGTEAIDLAIRGSLPTLHSLHSPSSAPPVVLSTAVEHSAVANLLQHLHTRGLITSHLIPVDPQGRARLDTAAQLLAQSPPPALLITQWANNETGVIQPVEELAQLAHAAGVRFALDATQWVGKLPTRILPWHQPLSSPPLLGEVHCDLLIASPHKFHGPKGVGLLYAAPGINLVPSLLGAQELGRRAGTENVPGIVGAGVAALEALAWFNSTSFPADLARLTALRDRLESSLLARTHALVNSAAAPRLWNTSNIAFPGLHSEALLLALSEHGLWASAGAACSSGSLEPSHVLLAMGLPDHLALGSLRFSLSRFSTDEHIAAAIDLIAAVVQTAHASSSPSHTTRGSA